MLHPAAGKASAKVLLHLFFFLSSHYAKKPQFFLKINKINTCPLLNSVFVVDSVDGGCGAFVFRRDLFGRERGGWRVRCDSFSYFVFIYLVYLTTNNLARSFRYFPDSYFHSPSFSSDPFWYQTFFIIVWGKVGFGFLVYQVVLLFFVVPAQLTRHWRLGHAHEVPGCLAGRRNFVHLDWPEVCVCLFFLKYHFFSFQGFASSLVMWQFLGWHRLQRVGAS